MMPLVKFRKGAMVNATVAGFVTATDIAEYLVRKGMPFREAHNITGKIVKYCIENKKSLTDLAIDELKLFSKLIDGDLLSAITVERSVNEKKSLGGTAKEMVAKRIKQIKNK